MLTDDPLVSIVLPVYNGQDYISDAITSVLHQSYTNFELIIVNDGSQDETSRIIASFIDDRIKVINNLENLRLPKSLNIGFRVATGSIHTWTSHDNVLESEFLEIMVKNLLIEGADFIYSNYKVVDESLEIMQIARVRAADNLISGNCIGASFCYKSSIFIELNGYDETKFLFEDYDFWVRCFLAGYNMRNIVETPYKYRIHNHQLSNTQSLPMQFLEYRYQLALYCKFGKRDINLDAFINLAAISVANGKMKLAFKCIMKSLNISPIRAIYLISGKLKRYLF